MQTKKQKQKNFKNRITMDKLNFGSIWNKVTREIKKAKANFFIKIIEISN